MKKLISLLLCLMFITCSVMSVSAVNRDIADTKATSGEFGGIYWSYDSSSKTLSVSGDTSMRDFNEDSKSPWCEADLDIERVDVAKGVTSVGSYSFYGLENLTEVNLPDTLLGISEYAFGYCQKLDKLNLPSSLKSIRMYAFANCTSLEEMNIPSSTSYIGEGVFAGCVNLSKVTVNYPYCEIYNSENTICDNTVIYGADKSTAQAYAEKYDREFVISEVDYVSPSGTCGENLSWSYDAGTKTLTISGSGAMYDYEAGSTFFPHAPWVEDYLDVKNVVVEDGVTTIGNGAFYYTAVSNITLPDSITMIGDKAFLDCRSLKSIEIPSGVKRIGASAFTASKLTSVTIPANVLQIDTCAFDRCEELKKVTILNPYCLIYDHTNTIYKTATIVGGEGSTAQAYAKEKNRKFEVIELESIVHSGECGDNVSWCYDDSTKILTISGYGDMTDYDYERNIAPWKIYPIEKVIVEEGITSLGNSAFADLKTLAEIELPQSLKKVGVYSFRECDQLKEIVLPDTLTTLSESSFGSCRGLTSFTIPTSVTELPPHVFGACQKLKSIYIHAGLTNIAKTAFQGCASVEKIVVDEANPVYDSRENCNSIILTEKNALYLGSNSTFIPDTITAIDEDAFDMCFGPSELIIPGSVKTIGKDAFHATRISNLIIEEGVEIIEANAFSMAQAPLKLILPESVKYIGENAFGYSMINEIVILNPECEIFDTSATLPNSWMTKVYGYENSTAQSYAEKYNRLFEIYVEPEHESGDVDLDGYVSIMDATDIQLYLAGYTRLSVQQKELADTDNDGDISIMDATQIQLILASLA